MPQQTFLNPYTIRLRERYSSDFLRLDDLPDGSSFKDILLEFLESLGEHRHIDEQAEKALKVDWFREGPGMIEGQLKSGQYGYASELEHIETGKVTHRTAHDAEYLPLYFRIVMREGMNEWIAIMQRFGIAGAKSSFQASLQEFLNNRGDDESYTAFINPLVTEESVKAALKGDIKKIRFIKSTIPDDVADDIGFDENDEREGEMELVVKVKRGWSWRFTSWMTDIVRGKVDASDYLEINNVTYEEVKLSVDVDGKQKTVPLKDVRDRLRTNIDITGSVHYDNDGHPTVASIRKAVTSKAPEFMRAVGWNV